MIDPHVLRLSSPLLQQLAILAKRFNCKPNHITYLGLGLGLSAAMLITLDAYLWAIPFIVSNRIADGVDGALARITVSSDFGAFIDIVFDFLFYALIPLSFAWSSPETNALAAATLLMSFISTATTFLACAIMMQKHHIQSPVYRNKGFFYLGGLTEASETTLFFILMCIFPQFFALLAYLLAGLCLFTCLTRILNTREILSRLHA